MRVMGPSAGGWQLFGSASGPGGSSLGSRGGGRRPPGVPLNMLLDPNS